MFCLAQMILVAFICGAAFAFAQTGAAYTDGATAKLSAAQIKKLHALKTAVALPTFVPAGYKLKKLEVPKPAAPSVVDYSLIYEDANGKTFTIQSTNDGIGDIPITDEATAKNPYFDSDISGGRYEDNTAVGVQWIGSLKKYQPPMQKIKQYYSLVSDAEAISVQTAVKVMKSLRYLKR